MAKQLATLPRKRQYTQRHNPQRFAGQILDEETGLYYNPDVKTVDGKAVIQCTVTKIRC